MLNRYKNMVSLSAKTPEELIKQIKSIPYEFSIKAMYGLNGRHFAYIVTDRPVTIQEVKPKEKQLTVKDLQNKFNKE